VREVELDPIPAEKLDSLHNTMPKVADAIEEALDWIEENPVNPRATRRRFTNGTWAIVRSVAGGEWLILCEEDPPGTPVVRVIDETVSL
jgi:hypothetical protein